MSEKDPTGKRNLIEQRSEVFMRDRKSYQGKNCASIVQVQDIALLSVKAS